MFLSSRRLRFRKNPYIRYRLHKLAGLNFPGGHPTFYLPCLHKDGLPNLTTLSEHLPVNVVFRLDQQMTILPVLLHFRKIPQVPTLHGRC
ncbi:MAG: hypothetical protein KatS3mg105_2089 [Gemmatales bacterium]|nr:MAG: hypothetical protein KatS3mg105_2089 [Gemmatales bacterium]